MKNRYFNPLGKEYGDYKIIATTPESDFYHKSYIMECLYCGARVTLESEYMKTCMRLAWDNNEKWTPRCPCVEKNGKPNPDYDCMTNNAHRKHLKKK